VEEAQKLIKEEVKSHITTMPHDGFSVTITNDEVFLGATFYTPSNHAGGLSKLVV